MTDAYYGCAFHLPSLNARSPLGTMTVSHTGEPNIVINLANLASAAYDGSTSGWFWHTQTLAPFSIRGIDPAGTVRYPHFALRSFGYALQAALNAGATSGTWPTTDFAVDFLDTVYPSYRISYGSNFTYTFSTAAGQRLVGGIYGPVGIGSTSPSLSTHYMSAMMFITGMRAGSQSWGVPFVCVNGELDGVDREPEGVASEVTSASGIGYGNSRYVTRIHRDWVQQFCTYELVHGPLVPLALDLTSTPYPFNDMFAHCRSENPFYVAHGGFGATNPTHEVFVLRGDGNYRRPRRATVGNATQWHVEFRTRVVGSFQVDS